MKVVSNQLSPAPLASVKCPGGFFCSVFSQRMVQAAQVFAGVLWPGLAAAEVPQRWLSRREGRGRTQGRCVLLLKDTESLGLPEALVHARGGGGPGEGLWTSISPGSWAPLGGQSTLCAFTGGLVSGKSSSALG